MIKWLACRLYVFPFPFFVTFFFFLNVIQMVMHILMTWRFSVFFYLFFLFYV
ncbi:hypothetical protein X975_04292, partial [Stegodyphus mimosarum]